MTIDDIKRFAMESFSKAPGSHDWDHTQRVFNLCMRIGRVEGANIEVLAIAAYLHDIGRPLQDEAKGRVCHAEKGAEIASELLESTAISGDKKTNIIHAIRSHRFRENASRPETLEAKILFDADKLDAIGAIGIGRAFQFAGEVGAKLHNPLIAPEDSEPYSKDDTGYREYRLKLSKIKDRLLTKEGRRIADQRHNFMEFFFKKFLREYEGIE